MDVKYIVAIVVIVVKSQIIFTRGCQHVTEATGVQVQFNFSFAQMVFFHGLVFRHENSILIFLGNLPGFHRIGSHNRNRFIIDDKSSSIRNISIKLLNVSREDVGQYDLFAPKGKVIGKFCLNILDMPGVAYSDSSNMYNETFALEGRDVIFSGVPAQIVPNNSRYDVRMTWLLNDEVLHSGGPFRVREDTLIIRTVPIILHGANVTYRATLFGHNITTSMTTRLLIARNNLDIALQPRQTFYVVTEGSSIPDIQCDVTYSLQTRVAWTRNENVIANGSVLHLGRVDRTTSGVYTCTSLVLLTGLSKEKSIYILVQKKPSAVSVIILVTLTGLVASYLVVRGTALCRKKILKRNRHSGQSPREIDGQMEMTPYPGLERETQNQQLYDTPDLPVTMDQPGALSLEHKVYVNQ